MSSFGYPTRLTHQIGTAFQGPSETPGTALNNRKPRIITVNSMVLALHSQVMLLNLLIDRTSGFPGSTASGIRHENSAGPCDVRASSSATRAFTSGTTLESLAAFLTTCMAGRELRFIPFCHNTCQQPGDAAKDSHRDPHKHSSI
jgi:hypothetical protein